MAQLRRQCRPEAENLSESVHWGGPIYAACGALAITVDSWILPLTIVGLGAHRRIQSLLKRRTRLHRSQTPIFRVTLLPGKAATA